MFISTTHYGVITIRKKQNTHDVIYANRIRRLPDWLGIGCVKCGTTWAWKQLVKHPQIYSPCKEVSYFNYAHLFEQQTYEAFLEGGEPDQKIGEWTPDYFHHYEAMHKIKDACPWVKMITIFRHPVERAFSNYKHAKFEERIPAHWSFNTSAKFWRVRGRSIYSQTLKEWYNLFPKEQILVLWYDDIKKEPLKLMQSIFRHIGVDDTFVPDDLDHRYDFDYHKDEDTMKMKLTEEDRKKWLDFYLPYTEELEKMTGRDLSDWKK